jgi:hypothetical protein
LPRGGNTDQIDKKNMEIRQVDDEVYTKVPDIIDELPDNTPRYILLSYPLTLVCAETSLPSPLRLHVTHHPP